jgi:uncharacterized protein YsxB (DUF464 family)
MLQFQHRVAQGQFRGLPASGHAGALHEGSTHVVASPIVTAAVSSRRAAGVGEATLFSISTRISFTPLSRQHAA